MSVEVATPGQLAFAIRTRRIAAGLSQNALAHAASIDPAYVNRMEKDLPSARHPSRHVVLSLAVALHLDTYQTDRFLIVAGLATETDWMTLALDYWARLSSIDRTFTGIALPPERETEQALEQTA